MIRRNQFQNLSKVLAFFVALIAVGAVAQTNNDDNIFSVADTNDCIGSNNYGDMYLMACTGSSKLRFSILGQHAHEGGFLVASGGPFDGKCMYADGNFWPKLKTCDLNDSNMNWFFLNGMFTNNAGLCLKHGQINPTNRLTVETCTATDTNVWSSIRLASLASVGGGEFQEISFNCRQHVDIISYKNMQIPLIETDTNIPFPHMTFKTLIL